MTYSRRCGTSFDDCAYRVCSCAMGAQPPCPPRPMTCERAQEIRARLTAHAPTAAESAEFWADEPAEYALERVVWHPEAANGSEMSTDTPAASSAGRSPHSKPVIFQYGEFGAWLIAWHCCSPNLGPNEFIGGGGTWREAVDAALAHVAEVHTPRPPADIAELVGLADYSKPWPADDPMDRTHRAEGPRG